MEIFGRKVYNMLQLLTALLLVAVRHVTAQDANCDFYSKVQSGQTYYVSSPNYPSSYTPGQQCRWIADCPTGTNCRLDCYDVQLPQTTSCSQDRLMISRTGDAQLTSSDYYCGTGSVTAVSVGTRISVGLITSPYSQGGRFSCRLYAQASGSGTDNSTCQCGYKKSNRIVGGQETAINEYPMMAGIVDLRISQIKCGGVIIAARYILTATHCLEGLTPSTVAVVVGEHDTTTGDSPATKVYAVTKFTRNPQFTDVNYDYDIAILTLASDIQFSGLVGPVCLPFKFVNSDFTGAKLTILGWGTLFIGGPTSNVLRKVDVDVISRSTCLTKVPTLTSRQICTYTPGKDACQDDSGGPLLYTDSSTGLLYNIGIVSYGKSCASRDQPGVNTDVRTLLNWIITNTPGANYCRK